MKIELADLVISVLYLILRNGKLGHYLLEMLLGKLLVITIQDPDGILHLRSAVLLCPKLQQQAFPGVAGSNPYRIQLLDVFRQDAFKLLHVGFYIQAEIYVIGQRLQVPGKISGGIQAAYHKGCKILAALIHMPVSQLAE